MFILPHLKALTAGNFASAVFKDAALDLNFALTKSLIDFVTGQNLVTFTRASSGTFVGSNGVLQTAATDVPRFDHNPTTGESLGLLVEEQRTNLMLRSEEFDNASWTLGQTSISANVIQSPNGSLTADKLIENSNTSTHLIQQIIAHTSGTTYTASCFVKVAERTFFSITFGSGFTGTQANSFFDLSNGTTPTSGATVVNVGNGWFRCSFTLAATASASSAVQFRLATSTSVASYTGDGTSGIYLWGAQLEAGAFPTSYIPTTSATVTRSADVASISGSNFSSWYQADEGTVFADIISAPVNTIAQQVCDFTNSATPTQDRTFARRNTSGGLATAVRAGNVLQVDQSTGVTVAGGGRYRHTFAYGPAVFASTANGVTATESSITTYPTVNQVALGQAYNNVQYLNGTIRRLTYWPQRLSNSTLQAITL
jgi:hypothetical protein